MIWILLGILLLGFAYWKVITPHSYWAKRGVKHGKTVPILGDNYGLMTQKESLADMISRLYKAIPGVRYSGVYQMFTPILLLKDPELIKRITVKDFDHFIDHLKIFPEEYEPLASKNLFNLRGEKWREMRATLSPAFTSSKMKGMFVLISECAERLASHFEHEGTKTVELKDVFSRFTNDVIASCAFGVTCDSLEQRQNEFYVMGKKVTDFSGFFKSFKMSMFFTMPSVAKILKLRVFSEECCDFFTKLVSDSIKVRKEKNIVRNDMINLLMEAQEGRLVYTEEKHAKETGFATVEESDLGKSKTSKTNKHEITLVDMTAQALVFFFAGFDAVSTLMCFMGYELGINPDIQEKLRNEIDDTLSDCNGKVTYEALNKMKYLDMVVSETLRKWPAAASTDRICVSPYTIPAENPGETPIHLNVGDVVWVPVWGLHHDPQYYPEPDRFDPERFSDENKGNINPYIYLPFGSGPRNCIGSRFALLETKVLFFHLLSKMEIVVVEKTEVPVKLTKSIFNLGAQNGFWFGFKKRNVRNS